jgi:predicted RNase H-like nuclease (RuvC/YqgF family)
VSPTRAGGGLDIYREVAQVFTDAVERLTREMGELKSDVRETNRKLENMRAEELSALRERCSRLEVELKIRAGVWGAVSGAVPAILAGLAWLLMK